VWSNCTKKAKEIESELPKKKKRKKPQKKLKKGLDFLKRLW